MGKWSITSILGFIFLIMLGVNLHAEHDVNIPVDHPQATLTRESGDFELKVNVSKNIFLTEYQEEWHTHSHTGDHHRGHDPLTWYAQYQEEEPYQDVEYYWEYYTDYEQYTEYECRHDPHHGHHCEWVWKTRPVTRRRWVSRTVTRWRMVTKTRLRIFAESHSHSVPVQVYDHTEKRNVTVVLPQGAVLDLGQAEKFDISFDGNKISVTPSSPYYPYTEVSYNGGSNNSNVTIVLGLKMLSKEEYGQTSIEGIELVGEQDQAQVKFVDKKPFYKIATSYFLQLVDEKGNVVIDNAAILSSWGREPFRTFSIPLVPGQSQFEVRDFVKGHVDYTLRLKVIRQSILFDGGGLEFDVETKRKGVLDSTLFGPSSIHEFKLVRDPNNRDRIFLSIVDSQAAHEKVKTRYSIKITRSTWFVGTKVVGRAEWENDGKPNMMFLLKKGADNPIGRELEEDIERGTEYSIHLYVDRESPVFSYGPVSFELNREQEP